MATIKRLSVGQRRIIVLLFGLIATGAAGLASAYATCYAYFRSGQTEYSTLAQACAAQNHSYGNTLGGTTSVVETPGPLVYGSVASGDAGWFCTEVTTITGTPANCASTGVCGTTTTRDTFLAIYTSLGNMEIYLPSCNFFVRATPPTQTPPKDPAGDPINPADGSVYKREDEDVAMKGSSPIAFRRFYNSTDSTGTDMGAGWRHTYDRSVVGRAQPNMVPYTGQSATVSAAYSTPADACQSGFPSIQSQIPGWQSATATYTNNTCVISTSAGVLGTLQVYSQFFTPPSGPATTYDVVRDDGETYHFTLNGAAINPPPGVSLRLATTPSGFTLTDDQDSVETYDSNGVLQSIRSRAGIVETMAYDTNGRLSTVTDSFGNTLTLSRNSYGAVSAVALSGGGTVQFAYDDQLRLTKVTNLDSTTRSYAYGNGSFPNALTQEVDENGTQYITWGYDSAGRGVSSSLSSGAYATSLTYNGDGTVTATDALGAVRTFSYVRSGDENVTSSITGSQCPGCEDGAATSHDVNGWVASRTDYNGNVTCYANDPVRGLELVRVEGFAPGSTCPANLATYVPATGTSQRKISTSWSASYRLPTLITESTRTTALTYDSSGNLQTRTVTDTTVTPNVSRTWTYTYNGLGQVLTARGPRTDLNSTTAYTYYPCTSGAQCGQVQTVTDAMGHVWTYTTYNPYGQPLTITDPNGVVTTLNYDARLRLISRSTAGETTTFSYYPTGLLKTVTLSDSSSLTYTYDTAHRLTQINDGLGNRVVYTIDSMGNRTGENTYDPGGALHRTHTRVFNNLSELYQDVNAANTAAVTTAYGYDGNGNQTSSAAPLARNSTQTYDALNRVTQITDPANGVTGVAYDANDNVVSVVDPRALITSYGYNGFGNMVSQLSPDTGVTRNTYDSGGNLSTSTDARGAVSTYNYDALNRITSVAYSSGGTTDQTITFTYDTGTNGLGHLTGAADVNHSLSWGYDALGRVTSKSQTVSGVAKSVGYTYTSGDLTTLTTPSGQTVTYGYNLNHQITSVAVNGASVLDTVTYEPLGPVNGWIWGNAATASRTYTGDGAISQISSNGIKTYAYDNALRITGITDTSAGSSSWTYGYDSLDRLTSGANGTITRGWTYDANGNRLAETGSAPSTYTISATSNQITAITGGLARTYGYDAAGNTVSYSSMTATYNSAGRLKTVSNGSVTETLIYNALGQRIAASGGAIGTVLYWYDEQGHLLGEYDGSGNLIEETVWLGDIPVATLRPGGAGIAVYYVHTDQLNTPRQVTRPADNAQMWTWFSDPFGTDAANANANGSGTFAYNLRFPGQVFDGQVGLHSNYMRDYDPAVGRYIESDPIGLMGGSYSTFAYADGTPINADDPNGEFVPLVTGAIGAAAGFFGNVAGQLISNGFDLRCVHWKDAGIAGGVGFAAGFAAPFVAASTLGAVALGAGSNVVQYGITQSVNGDAITGDGVLWSLETGAFSGWVGGAVTTGAIGFSTRSPWINQAIARISNRQLQQAEAVRDSNLLRNLIGGIAGNINPPTGDASCSCGH